MAEKARSTVDVATGKVKAKDEINDPQPHPNNDIIVDVVDTEKNVRAEPEKIDVSNLGKDNIDSLIRDPDARPSILSYPSNQRDEIRQTYIKLGTYQLHKSKYHFSLTGPKGNMRSFQAA
ncbi:hypothetical protein OSB04_001615 [Centaurea solstitialis]|uniref:Uncharacterized protein n=1 Tax=Centaurea solstitialis TaxID=347529 RepID=A0AA38TRN7_9ASTR|nr:hypothetical protein OSB04_001615 [Centaurea solstitialis]